MQLREFAEQVLYGGTLDLKLSCPDTLVDDDPGQGIEAPALPNRPAGLAIVAGGSQFKLPGLRALEQDPARGQLLHFFANHELLATELMALVLLKFPDAPKAFRRGVLQTLKDEQHHTRLYIDRLKQLGVEFGQHPVNGYFWSIIAPMTTPMEYVSRLSLTFEQANLDFSGYYADLFRQLDDKESQVILEQIHRDEIAHVGYGLKWFRRWKDPRLSDWEAFQLQLPYPLSPNRAKANPFNAPARLKAGFEPAFINELFVYSKSKGRPPSVHVFNPLAELFMGQGKDYKPNNRLLALAHDLANLPQFLCGTDDVVLVPQQPRTEFLARLKENGFDLPQFEVLKAGRITQDSELIQRKIGALRPWAWSPDTLQLLQPLAANLCAGAAPLLEHWESRIRPLYSKAWAADFLRDLIRQQNHPNWLCPESYVGRCVVTYEEALRVISEIRAQNHQRVVAKAPFGLAGNNQLRLWEPVLLNSQLSWIRRALQHHGALVIEPWLDRVLDFSVQFEMSPKGLHQVGWVRMQTDARGQYTASMFTPRFTQGFDHELAALAHGDGTSANRLKQWYASMAPALESHLAKAGFSGALGIDAFVYRDQAGSLRLKPIVEINPRYTLGRVLLELMRHAAAGRCGKLELIGRPGLRKLSHATFTDLAATLERDHPPQWTGHPKKLISSGAYCLNDPTRAQSVLAVWHVD